MRLSSVPPYRWLAVTYIEFFRGVPALLVSPYIEAGTIVHARFEHASLPATARACFAPDADPLSNVDPNADGGDFARDGAAPGFRPAGPSGARRSRTC